MTRFAGALTLFLFAISLTGSAHAAPVPRSVELKLTLVILDPYVAPHSRLEFSVPATVSVDATAQSLAIPGNLFGGVSDSVVIPVSAQTAIRGVSVENLDLLAGTFRPGGVASQVPSEICPPLVLPASINFACDLGSSFGGPAGLVGTLGVVIVPGVVTLQLPLAPTFGAGGRLTYTFNTTTFDGAPWTLGRGHVAFTGFSSALSATGTLMANQERFSLVTPAFVGISGVPLLGGVIRPWRLEIAFTDGLGIPQFIVDTFDRDGDGVTNWSDNCPDDPNLGQEDADGDGKGDACEFECQDGLDNDGDGDIDLADSACLIGNFDDESPPCADGADNDSDGLVDFPADPGCANVAWPLENPACNDGADNDGDGDTDHPADSGCAAASALSEAPQCSDGLDNDLDGATDHPADAGCENDAGATESPPCNDGINNDGAQDALIDFDGGAAAGLPPGQQTGPDPQCNGVGWGPTEIQEPGCGLGGEVALLVAGLAKLRRRRRQRNAGR